jgi:hypothetical protein
MSTNRICPNCFKEEGGKLNFGNYIKAAIGFHSQKWCKCGYNSPQEMMDDQDMGFSDPNWIPIAKYFIEEYNLRLQPGLIKKKDEQIRFFLKLLKSSAGNYRKTLELTPKKDEDWEYIYDGKPSHKPKTKIFE